MGAEEKNAIRRVAATFGPPINDGPAGPHLIKPRKGDGADDLGRAKKGKR